MNDASIVIIGANGQLGTALKAAYPKATALDYGSLDITDPKAVREFDWSGTTTVINAAAYTNVDGAETTEGREAAWKVNALGPRNLANAASRYDMTIVHISSDYVFDGTKQPHAEDEPYTPLCVYGESKAAGDIALSLTEKHYILRTTWVIGEGKNFVRTMLDLAGKGIEPKVVNDQIGRLTFTSELVRAIDHILTNDVPYGTYNVTNSGESKSWADITRDIFQIAGYSLKVTGITTAEYYQDKPSAAPRPLLSVMDLGKIKDTGFVSIDWSDDLHRYITKELSGQ